MGENSWRRIDPVENNVSPDRDRVENNKNNTIVKKTITDGANRRE